MLLGALSIHGFALGEELVTSDSTEVRTGQNSPQLTTENSCESHFNSNNCQQLIDEAEPKYRKNFLDCSSGNFDAVKTCGGHAVVGFAAGKVIERTLPALKGIAARAWLPVTVLSGAYLTYKGLKAESECYEDIEYKKSILRPLKAYFSEEYANSLLHLGCIEIESQARRLIRRVQGEIFEKRMNQERYLKAATHRPDNPLYQRNLNLRFPENKRILTENEIAFEQELSQIDQEQEVLLDKIQEYMKKNPCRSWEYYAKAFCGIAGGIGSTRVVSNSTRRIKNTLLPNVKSLGAFDDWVKVNLPKGGSDGLATWQKIQTMSSALSTKEARNMTRTLSDLVGKLKASPLTENEKKRFYNIITSIENSLFNISKSTVGSPEYIFGKKRLAEKLAILNEMLQASATGTFAMLANRLRPLNPEITERNLQQCLFGQVCKTPLVTVDDVVSGGQSQGSVGQSVEYVSSQFKGVSYGAKGGSNSKIFCGELKCTTYAERVTAAVRAQSGDDFTNSLNFVRYNGRPESHHTYSHMPSLWVKNSQANGITRDITREIGGASTRSIRRTINQEEFLRRQYESALSRPGLSQAERTQLQEKLVQLSRDATKFPLLKRQRVSLPYIPAENLLANPALLNRIPAGTRFSVVVDSEKWIFPNGKNFRQNVGSGIMISHTGFIFRRNGQTYIRHSSSLFDGQVREDPIEEYLRKYVVENNYRLGLHLEEILPSK